MVSNPPSSSSASSVSSPSPAAGPLEVTLTRDRVLALFEANPMRRIRVLDVNLTLASIAVATTLLEVQYSTYRVSSGHGSDRSASPKIVTGPKILTLVCRTTSNLPVSGQF